MLAEVRSDSSRASPEHGDEQIEQQDVGHEQEDDEEEHHQPVGIERDAGARLDPGWARPDALLRRAVDMLHEGHCEGGHSETGQTETQGGRTERCSRAQSSLLTVHVLLGDLPKDLQVGPVEDAAQDIREVTVLGPEEPLRGHPVGNQPHAQEEEEEEHVLHLWERT